MLSEHQFSKKVTKSKSLKGLWSNCVFVVKLKKINGKDKKFPGSFPSPDKHKQKSFAKPKPGTYVIKQYLIP
jgi:hypothetical protein